MSKIYRTSRGDAVDMDMLRLANESTIAIGNMRTNARGDELGPGGKIVKTRAQIMQEYHKLNTPMAHDEPISESSNSVVAELNQLPETNLATPIADDTPVTESTTTPEDVETPYTKPRGRFADSVAQQAEVNQELLKPISPKGVSRI